MNLEKVGSKKMNFVESDSFCFHLSYFQYTIENLVWKALGILHPRSITQSNSIKTEVDIGYLHPCMCRHTVKIQKLDEVQIFVFPPQRCCQVLSEKSHRLLKFECEVTLLTHDSFSATRVFHFSTKNNILTWYLAMESKLFDKQENRLS